MQALERKYAISFGKSSKMYASQFCRMIIPLALSIVFLVSPTLVGQQTYHPETPAVESMVRAALGFLEANSGGGRDNLLVCAIAIIEASKRYDQLVPKDNPIVQACVAEILANTTPNPESDNYSHYNRAEAVYQPALACIILCEVDDSKYNKEIRLLIDHIQNRQEQSGSYSYLGRKGTDDTSQTQYAALALFVAKHHGYKVDYEVPKRALGWLTSAQTPEGSWYYHYGEGLGHSGRKQLTLSIHCSGLGTVYLLSDLLKLSPRSKNMVNLVGNKTNALPPAVSVYVKPKDGLQPEENKKGPLVNFDRGKLGSTKRGGNQFLRNNFSASTNHWNYYYLYALERYAYFREQAEGGMRDLPDWYDQGVEFLMTQQNENGSFPREKHAASTELVNTALGVMFLVRSSEVLVMPASESTLTGGQGFEENQQIRLDDKGRIKSMASIKGMSDVMTMLETGASDKDLEAVVEAMDEAVGSFSMGNRSRAEKMAFMQALVKDRNYFRRMIAVKFLAREQDMDNVPALLYAIGDPDLRICREAHNGLRLISRKIKAFPVAGGAGRAEFDNVKKKWTDWFLKIRPEAELLD